MAQESKETTKMPIAYMLWLTFRSEFIDEIAIKDSTILERWKEFENKKIEELELWHLHRQQQP